MPQDRHNNHHQQQQESNNSTYLDTIRAKRGCGEKKRINVIYSRLAAFVYY